MVFISLEPGEPFPVWRTLQPIKEQVGESAPEGSCNKKPGAICNIFNKSLTVSFPNIKKKKLTHKKEVKVENAEW